MSEPPQPKPGEPIPFPQDHISGPLSLPTRRTILLASNKSIHLVDVASGRIVFAFVPRPAATGGFGPSCLDLSPDGQTVAIGCLDKTVRLFELATGKEVLADHTAGFAGQAGSSEQGGLQQGWANAGRSGEPPG